jgi:dolichyl-phosphate-mannose--protein O-mannosyl transferase
MANPAVLVLGLAASLAFMRAARKTRAPELGLLILAGAAQFVPWMLVQRGTFLYHYGGTVPFLGIALGWWLAVHAPRRWRPPLTGAALAACLAVFLAILPMLDGWYVSASYRQAVKATFPWMF